MMHTQIKSLLKLIVLCSALGSTSFCALPERYNVISQETIKDFHYQEDQPWVTPPQEIHFSEQLNKQRIVVLHLWATSCPSCIQELDALEQTAEQYMNDPIDFIILSLNDPNSGVLRNYFNRKRYVHLKPYHNASSTRPAITGLPSTFFFNKNGKLIGRIEGAAKWHSEEMKRLLNRLILEESATDIKHVKFYTRWFQRLIKWFS